MQTKQPIKIDGLSLDNFKDNSTLWNYSDLSAYLKLSENTLRRYVMDRRIPFIKIGNKAIRFKPDQINAWLKNQSFEGC